MTSDLDKFKRRLIRSVASLLAENKTPEEIWEKLQKESGCDCQLLWNRMCTLTLKKLKRLLAAEDIPHNVTSVARLSQTDWLLVDLVLVHESHDFIGLDKLQTSRTEYRPLMDLFSLVQRYRLEEGLGDVERWAAATKVYNSAGRVCSPMLLQRRWYQLKEATRSSFYSLWMNYRGNSRLWDQCQQFVPTRLQMAVARKFPDVITAPFPTWEELVETRQVVMREQFEARIKNRPPPQPVTAPTSESDIVLVEPQIETIDLGVDSDTEENKEQNLNEDSNSRDRNINEDSNSIPYTSSIQASDCEDTQHSWTDTSTAPTTEATTPTTEAMSTDIQIKKEPEEIDGLSNVKILAASHIPTEALDNLTENVVATTEDNGTNSVVKIKQEPSEDHRTLDVNTRAENIKKFLESTESLLQDDEFLNYFDETDSIIAQKAKEYLKSTDKTSSNTDALIEQKAKDFINTVDNTDAIIAKRAKKYINTSNVDTIIDKTATIAQNAKDYAELTERDDCEIIDETDIIIAQKANDYLKQNLKVASTSETLIENSNADKGEMSNSIENDASFEMNTNGNNKSSANIDINVISSSNDEDSDNVDDVIKLRFDHFLNKTPLQTNLDRNYVNLDDKTSDVSQERCLTDKPSTKKTNIEQDIEIDPISFKMNASENRIEFIDDGIVEEDDDDNSKESLKFPAPIAENPIIKKELIEGEEVGEYIPQTFDLKLIMTPVVFCVKLENISTFRGKSLNFSVRKKQEIEEILLENKPILKTKTKEVPIKREIVKEEVEETHENDDLFHNPNPDRIFTEDTSKFEVSEERKMPNIDSQLVPKQENLELQEETNENDDPYSDSESDTASVSPNISDDQKVKVTSYLLQKPRNRSYNPIQLCKNPDFNTRLKRLPVGFFSSMRNRQLLKSCKPMTIDLNKAFEPKLVNGTLYLKSSTLPPISESIVSEEDASAVTTVVPSAMPLQSLIDSTVNELLQPKVTNNPTVVIDDDDDKPLSFTTTCMQNLVQNTVKDLLPSEYNNQNDLTMSNNQSQIPNLPSASSVQTGYNDQNPTTSNAQVHDKTHDVINLTERNKTINLPDISKVREINQKLLTAEVTPIRVQQSASVTENLTPAQGNNTNDGESINNVRDWRRRPNNILNKPKPPKTLFRIDAPPSKICVPWNRPVPSSNKMDDFLLTKDTLNKILNKINGLDMGSKSCKQKTNWILEDESGKQPKHPPSKKTNKPPKQTTPPPKPKPQRKAKDPYCCWINYRNEQLKKKARVSRPHRCRSACTCCCELENFRKQSVTTICLSDDEDSMMKACESIEAVVQQSNTAPAVKVNTRVTHLVVANNRTRRNAVSCNTCAGRGMPLDVDNITSSRRPDVSRPFVEPQNVEEHCSTTPNTSIGVSSNSSQPFLSPSSNIQTVSLTKHSNTISTQTADTVDIPKSSPDMASSLMPSISITAPSLDTTHNQETEGIVPQHKIVVSFPDSTPSQNNLNNTQKDEITVISKKTISRKPYITIMPKSSSSIIDVNKKRLVIKTPKKNLPTAHNIMSLPNVPFEKPIHLGKNKILLTTVKFPPEIRSIQPPTPVQANPKVIPALPLPPGVQLVLMPNGQLNCVMDPSVKLDASQLLALPTIISVVQQQLINSGVGIQNITESDLTPLTSKSMECNEVIKLSDDEEPADASTINLPNTEQGTCETVKTTITPETSSNDVDIVESEINTTEVLESSDQSRNKTISDTTSEIKETGAGLNETNFLGGETCPEKLLTDAKSVSVEKHVPGNNSPIVIESERPPIETKDASALQHLFTTDSTTYLPIESCSENTPNETESETVNEKFESIKDNPNKSVSSKTADEELKDKKETEESVSQRKSMDRIDKSDDQNTDTQKDSNEQTNKGVGRNLLSDLMEMSGISEEDIVQASHENIPQAATELASSVVVDPNINITALGGSIVIDPNVPVGGSIVTNPPVENMTNVINAIPVINNVVNLPELTPVTSLAELRYACDNNGKFFKLDLETGSITSIVVGIKKSKVKKVRKEITVDLTLDEENPTPNEPDRTSENDAESGNTEHPRPVKLIKAVHRNLLPKRYVSILKNKERSSSLLTIDHMKKLNETIHRKKHKRKEALQPRIEANINLADYDEPIEEEYLDDTILEGDYTIVYNDASLDISKESAQYEDDDSSDDEPLAVKAKRIRRDETVPENTAVVPNESENSISIAPATNNESALPAPTVSNGSAPSTSTNVPSEPPISPSEDISMSFPVDAMDVDDQPDDDCILGF